MLLYQAFLLNSIMSGLSMLTHTIAFVVHALETFILISCHRDGNTSEQEPGHYCHKLAMCALENPMASNSAHLYF